MSPPRYPLPISRRLSSCLLAALSLPAASAITFSPPALISNSIGNPSAVQAVDLDGDGDLDLFATEGRNGFLVWWENLGKGDYRRAGEWRLDGHYTVKVADFDGDGLVDLLGAEGEIGGPQRFALWKGKGLAGFGPRGADLPFTVSSSSDIASLSFPDVNGDGRPDVVQSGKVWLNQGDGTFAAGNPLPADAVKPYSITGTWTDVDGDGRLDFVYISDGFKVALNQGAAGFADPVVFFSEPQTQGVAQLLPVSLPELSATDCLLVLGQPYTSEDDTYVYVLARRSAGWQKMASLKVRAGGNYDALALSVVTNDGKPRILLEKLAYSTGDHTSPLLRGKVYEITAKMDRKGAVSLISKALSGLPVTASGLQFADLNGDGKQDVLYASRSAYEGGDWGSLQ